MAEEPEVDALLKRIKGLSPEAFWREICNMQSEEDAESDVSSSLEPIICEYCKKPIYSNEPKESFRNGFRHADRCPGEDDLVIYSD